MAESNPTPTKPRRARERPALPPTLAPAPAPVCVAPPRLGRKLAAKRQAPAHHLPSGVLSHRAKLADHERAVVDAALAILGCHLSEPGAVCDSPQSVKDYLSLHLAPERREIFMVLFLDAQNCLIGAEPMFVGTLTQTSVYPREVVCAALEHEAAAVILAHNHPSGQVQPSRADMALTTTLKQALALVDVRVLDHVIVAPGLALSMAERGLL